MTPQREEFVWAFVVGSEKVNDDEPTIQWGQDKAETWLVGTDTNPLDTL